MLTGAAKFGKEPPRQHVPCLKNKALVEIAHLFRQILTIEWQRDAAQGIDVDDPCPRTGGPQRLNACDGGAHERHLQLPASALAMRSEQPFFAARIGHEAWLVDGCEHAHAFGALGDVASDRITIIAKAVRKLLSPQIDI